MAKEMNQITLVLLLGLAATIQAIAYNGKLMKLNVVSMTWSIKLRIVVGTCASIGYSQRCCHSIRDDAYDCKALNGLCYCNSDCHIFEDCCEDVACPERKYSHHI